MNSEFLKFIDNAGPWRSVNAFLKRQDFTIKPETTFDDKDVIFFTYQQIIQLPKNRRGFTLQELLLWEIRHRHEGETLSPWEDRIITNGGRFTFLITRKGREESRELGFSRVEEETKETPFPLGALYPTLPV